MKKLVVLKKVGIGVSGIILIAIFELTQGFAIDLADAKREIGQQLFISAIPLLLIGLKLVLFDWWNKTARISYILLAPVLCIFSLVCFHAYSQLSAEYRMDKSAIHTLEVQGPQNLNWSIQERDKVMWAKLISKAYVCRNCNDFPEFAEHQSSKSYPVIVEAPTQDDDTEYTAVLGVVTYMDNEQANPKVITTPMLYYYVGYQNGARHRYSDAGEASYRSIDGEWHPLVLPNILERGQTYTMSVPDQREFNSVYNTFYLMAQKP
jgi:hypothetical protein